MADCPFKLTEWEGQSEETNIPSRDLPTTEVEVINKVFLGPKGELSKRREKQTLGRALGEVEQNLAALATAVEERTNRRLASLQKRLRKKIEENHLDVGTSMNRILKYQRKAPPPNVDSLDVIEKVPA